MAKTTQLKQVLRVVGCWVGFLLWAVASLVVMPVLAVLCLLAYALLAWPIFCDLEWAYRVVILPEQAFHRWVSLGVYFYSVVDWSA